MHTALIKGDIGPFRDWAQVQGGKIAVVDRIDGKPLHEPKHGTNTREEHTHVVNVEGIDDKALKAWESIHPAFKIADDDMVNAAKGRAAKENPAAAKLQAEATKAWNEAQKAKAEADKAKAEAEKAKAEAETAKAQAEIAKADADKAKASAEKAEATAKKKA